MNSRFLFLICVALASASPSVLFALHGANEAAGLILVPGLAWALPELFPRQRRLGWLHAEWISNLCLLITAIAAAGLLINGWAWWWALATICIALAAWDLHAFRLRVFAPQTTLVGTTLRYFRTQMAIPNGGHESNQLGADGGEEPAPESSTKPAKSDNQADVAQESAAFEHRSAERTHLRALALVTLAGLAFTTIAYELAARIRFRPALEVGLLLSLGLVIVMSLLARFLVRS